MNFLRQNSTPDGGEKVGLDEHFYLKLLSIKLSPNPLCSALSIDYFKPYITFLIHFLSFFLSSDLLSLTFADLFWLTWNIVCLKSKDYKMFGSDLRI